MKLYPKRLNDLAHLEQEKRMLKKARKDTSLENMLTVREGETGNEDILSQILPFITSAARYSDAIKFVFPLVRKFIRRRREKKNDEEGTESSSSLKDKVTDMLKNATKELLGGYLKWKSIELGLKALWHFMESPGQKGDK